MASPSPAATATVSSPAASPTAASGLDDRFGFIVTSGSAIWLRPETDPRKRTTLTGRMFSVSPDGTQVAFWRASGGAEELFVLPAARPDQERSVYKVPTGQQGGQIVSANDGSGLLSTVQVIAVGVPGGAPVQRSTLITVDLRAANAATIIATLSDGRMHVALGWDRTADLAAAGESGVTSTSPRAPAMETYLTIKTRAPVDVTRRPVTDGIAIPLIAGSPDAKYVYGRTGDPIRVWPLADYSAGNTFEATGLAGKLLWRPGTAQLAWLAGSELKAYDVSSKSAVTLFRGLTQNPAGVADLQLFRADGSAAVVGPVTLGPGVVAPMTLLSLGSGTAVQFETAGAIGGGFIASSRLR